MRLDARLTGEGPDSLACEIRDFCVGGLFIAVPRVNGNDYLLLNQRELSRDDVVRVHFSVEGDGGPAEFEASVRIAGAFKGGIGVEFHDADPPTIRALQEIAARQAKAQSGESAAESPHGAVGASERGALMGRFRDLLSDFARTETEALFESAEETLFVGARDAGSDVAEKEFLEAQQEVRKLKPVVSKAFIDAAMHGLEHMREGRLQPARERGAEGGGGDAELSLIDTQNFGDILRVKQILGRCERRFKDSEFDLEHRLSKFLHVAVDQDTDPVGVHAICYAFHDAIQNLGATRLARGTVFDAFEHTLVEKLTELQERFIEVLEQAGVAGEGKDRKYHVPKQPKAAKAKAAPQPDEVPAQPAEPSATTADAGVPTTQAGPAGDAAAAPPGPAAAQPAAAPDAAVAGTAAPGYAMPGHTVPAGPGIALNDAFAAGRSLLQIGRQPAAAATATASATPPSVSSAVMNEITRLQRARAGDPLSSTGPRMVLERVAKAVEEAGGNMTEAEQDAIDVTASLLDCVLTDPLIGEGAKSRIHRLALPLMKVALSDASFFEDMAHPARGVVNQLGRVEFDGEGQAETEALVDPLVEKLVNERELNKTVFAEALSWLERVAQDQSNSYTEKVREIADSRDQQQALVKARVGDAKAGEPTRRVPEELRQWLARARHLKVGDTVVMETRPGKKERALLAWVAENKGTFQFVDPHGNKGPSLTEQQLAIELRRGSAKVLTGSDLPVLDRGLYQMLHEMHHKLADVATRDELTGLLNQREFELRLEDAVDEARRDGCEHVLCVLDIDNFGELNERAGRKAGNSLLRQIARVLEKHVVDARDGSVARLDADAFGVLLARVSEGEGVEFAERQRRAIDKSRCVWKGEKLPLSVSVGVVTVGPDAAQTGALLADARAACLRARDEGGNRVASGGAATAEPGEPAEEIPIWTGSVSEVLEGEQLVLRAQRVQPLSDGNGVKPHFEILLGVQNPDGEIYQPREFIQAAESDNLMPTVDRWVIRNTLKWMAQHRKDVVKSGGYAINLSSSTLADDSLVEFIIEQLTESKVPPAKVLFEMRESVVLQNLTNASDFVRVLKEYGCRTSLDHFGTGDASFSYLKRLPVDYVKMDGSFVRDMMDNPNDLAVVKSVNEVGHLLGIQTVAPFVENDAVLKPLREIGVDFAQGFAIEQPEVLKWD
jgi:diguanylate cyclase (GGDEF)-like protein